MAVVRNLLVRAGADFSGLRSAMQGAQKDMNGFQKGMSGALKGLAASLAAIGIGAVVKDAMKSAMDVEASMQQINRTMGQSAASFANWASDGAKAFGLSKSDAIKYGAVYSNLLSGFSKDTTDTMKNTEALLKASGVVASATGRSMTDVMERIRSGMLGNTESIEDLGINVNIAMISSTEAFKKFANGKSWDQLDFKTQQQIRLFAILEQSTKKYGDSLANNTNTKMLMFTLALKNVQLSLGQAFLPILNIVLPLLTTLANALSRAMSFFAQFMNALFGKSDAQTKGAQKQAGAVNGLGSAYTAAGKAAAKAAGSLAGFDQVNTLSNSNAAGSGAITDPSAGAAAGGDTSGTGSAMEEISAKAREMADKAKAAFGEIKTDFGLMSDFILSHKDIIVAALAGLGTAFVGLWLAVNWEKIVAGITTALEVLGAIFAAVAWEVLIVIAVVALLVAGFVYLWQTNEGFRDTVTSILKAIGDMSIWLWNNVLVPFGQWLGVVLVAAWNGLVSALAYLWNNILVPLGTFIATVFMAYWNNLTAVITWLWQNVFVPLGEFLLWFWNNVIVPLSAILVDVLGVAFTAVMKIVQSFWDNVMIPLGNFFKTVFGPTVTALSAIITALKDVFLLLWNTALAPLATFLSGVLKVVFKSLIDIITFLWKEVLKPVVTYVGGALLTVFTTVFKAIGGVIDGLATALTGVMTFITGVFTGNWQKAWDGVKMIFKGVFDSLYNIVKTPLNLIIDMVNLLIGGLNQISITVPDWVPGLGGKSMGINIPTIPKLARGGVTQGATDMGNYVAGEAGAEMIVPLENTSFVDKLASALGTAVMNAMQFSGSGSNGGGDIIMDGVVVARVLSPHMAQENTRQGSPMIKTSGNAIIVTG